MLEVCQPHPATSRRTYSINGPMAFRVMGIGHHGSVLDDNSTTEISGGRYRLLHQVGGGRSTGHHYGEECAKFHMEEHRL